MDLGNETGSSNQEAITVNITQPSSPNTPTPTDVIPDTTILRVFLDTAQKDTRERYLKTWKSYQKYCTDNALEFSSSSIEGFFRPKVQSWCYKTFKHRLNCMMRIFRHLNVPVVEKEWLDLLERVKLSKPLVTPEKKLPTLNSSSAVTTINAFDPEKVTKSFSRKNNLRNERPNEQTNGENIQQKKGIQSEENSFVSENRKRKIQDKLGSSVSLYFYGKIKKLTVNNYYQGSSE
eukprot:snap_masked-scaffold_9-processed-gene-4.44-mRNA-1 protein AED:1.00 eAED:1.00 QI:0/-1/0/0/-1/1/1/0/233